MSIKLLYSSFYGNFFIVNLKEGKELGCEVYIGMAILTQSIPGRNSPEENLTTSLRVSVEKKEESGEENNEV